MMILLLVLITFTVSAQNLSFCPVELTAPEFIMAVEKSSTTCILPIGVFGKHGPHLPLGTDLYTSREIALRAADREYTVVFPWWYAQYQNHYSCDGSKANAQAGELLLGHVVDQLVETIKNIKKDEVVQALQNQFFDVSDDPLKTKQ